MSIDIPKWIRDGRKGKTLTQDKLAEELGLIKQTISHWETGRHAPSYQQMLQMAAVFKRPLPTADHDQSAPAAAPPAELPSAAERTADEKEQTLLTMFRKLKPDEQMAYLEKLVAEVSAAEARRLIRERFGANGTAPDHKVAQAFGPPPKVRPVTKKAKP